MGGWKECLLTECHGHGRRRRRRNALFRSRRRRRRRRRQIDTLDAHCRGKKEREERARRRIAFLSLSPSLFRSQSRLTLFLLRSSKLRLVGIKWRQFYDDKLTIHLY